jgi:hypothetical protein
MAFVTEKAPFVPSEPLFMLPLFQAVSKVVIVIPSTGRGAAECTEFGQFGLIRMVV